MKYLTLLSPTKNSNTSLIMTICVLATLLASYNKGYAQFHNAQSHEGYAIVADHNNNSSGDDIVFGFNSFFATDGGFFRAVTIKDNTGKVGIGTANPYTKLHITGGVDAALGSHGYLMTGSVSSYNVVIDNNEIMARNNGAKSTLFLQGEGGDLQVNGQFMIKDGGNVGIGTTNPTEKLHVNGFLKVNNEHGSLTIGSINTAYSHFYTDRPRYFFNKRIIVDEGIISSHHDENFQLQTDQITRMTILNTNGNVGIGTTSPAAQLSLGGWSSGSSGSDADESAQLLLSGLHNSGVNKGGTNGTYKLKIEGYDNDGSVVYPIYLKDENSTVDFWIKNRASSNATPTMYFAGNTGIGTTTPSEKLEVAGKIKADGVVLSIGAFPDYVFETGYNLMPLAELEAYIKANKHLPNVPSEQEVVENGADLGHINILLVEKVEELTLYTIEQQKLIQAQADELKQIKQQVNQLIEKK